MRQFLRALLLSFTATVATAAAAGELMVITLEPGRPVVRINPDDGARTNLANTNMLGGNSGLSVVHPVGRKLYAISGPMTQERLFTFDLETHEVTSLPIPETTLYRFMVWHAPTQRLLVVRSDPGGFVTVMMLDPATGTRTPLLTFAMPAVSPRPYTYDPATNRIFVSSGSTNQQRLWVVDLDDGSIANYPIPSAGSYRVFEWDAATGRILAVASVANPPLHSIDPATGAVQQLATLAVNGPQIVTDRSDVDQATRRLYFFDGRLVAVDLDTFAVTTAPVALSMDLIGYFNVAPSSHSSDVPALSLPSMLLLAGLLVVAGLFVMTRAA